MNELQHLGGEQPALAHLVPVAQIAVDQAVEVVEGTGGTEAARLVQGVDHVLLAALDIAHEELAQGLLGPLSAIELYVGHPVVDLEDHKVGKPRHHRLYPLAEEELLQMVVAQGGELHIDLAHDAHPHLGLPRHGAGSEVGADLVEDGAHLAAAHALSRLEAVHQLLGPAIYHGVGGARLHLIGADLVGYPHDQVAVHHTVYQLADQVHAQAEARVLLQAEGDGDHGDIVHPRLGQGLPQQMDIVAGPAAAAGLGDEQGHLVGVIAPVLNGIHKLADDQQGGVAGVVVDIFQPLVHHRPPLVVQLVHVIALQLQQLAEHAEVDGQHLGHQNGILLLHLLGEQQAAVFIVY